MDRFGRLSKLCWQMFRGRIRILLPRRSRLASRIANQPSNSWSSSRYAILRVNFKQMPIESFAFFYIQASLTGQSEQMLVYPFRRPIHYIINAVHHVYSYSSNAASKLEASPLFKSLFCTHWPWKGPHQFQLMTHDLCISGVCQYNPFRTRRGSSVKS